MLPFNRSWIHQLDRGRVTVRRSSGTITPYLVAQRCRTVLKGGTYGLFCRPKVPCDTQRRHLRLILSPKGAVRHSKAALTAYSVAQRYRATLKGGTYGLFCRPKVPCCTQRRHLRGLFVAREHSDKLSREQNAPFRSRDASEDPFVSRTRRLAHETTSADPSVSRTRLFAHETTLEPPCATGTLRGLYGRSSMPPR